MTDYWVPQLTALTPGGGYYLNEVSAIIQCNKSTEDSRLPKLMLPRILNRPTSISLNSSRPFMAPTMTSSLALRASMIRPICPMQPPLLGASTGTLRRMVGSARFDAAMMEDCKCSQDESSSAMLRSLWTMITMPIWIEHKNFPIQSNRYHLYIQVIDFPTIRLMKTERCRLENNAGSIPIY